VPIAVLVVHGIGDQAADFADGFIARLRDACREHGGDGDALVARPCWWAPVLQAREEDLARRLGGERLGWSRLRRFMTGFAADALAYQPVPGESGIYDEIHAQVDRDLAALADAAGANAPLAVVSHSLGTVVMSNHLWNLQRGRGPAADHRALVHGRTLDLAVTMGSPLALWALRWPGFGTPITVPAPGRTSTGGWLNLYDADDVIGYPLRPLNQAYAAAVEADIPVRCTPAWRGWTPASHLDYWDTPQVTDLIGARLARLQGGG
jgi:hypothetical protein